MAAPTEFSLEAVRYFMIEKGGKVTNHELVKHFKQYLTNPESRVEARTIFKEYVNTLASIKTEEGEKYLVLKRKYRPYELLDAVGLSSPSSMTSNETAPSTPLSPTSASGSALPYHPMEVLDLTTPPRQPPPYRPPPPPISPPRSSPSPVANSSSMSTHSSLLSTLPEGSAVSLVHNSQESSECFKPVAKFEERGDLSNNFPDGTDPPPPVPPRRRSTDRGRIDNKENLPESVRKMNIDEQKEDGKVERPTSEVDGEHKISVKERMQKFNRLASESDLLLLQPQSAKKKATDKSKDDESLVSSSPSPVTHGGWQGVDDDDRVSVTSLNPKTREWLVRAAQGNYQDLAKLASEDSRLPRVKDPTTTALHWAAKHGNEDIVKLIAGSYGVNPDVRSHGGYTPLHIATQFGHENVFNLLVTVYKGNPQLRDWSGRMPRQYIVSQDTSVSSETIRKMKARKKHSEKDLGFLRIGSLNVRVKRTTEAFSNFLGVGSQNSSGGSNYGSSSSSGEKILKSWGSADNIQEVDRRTMPPPKYPAKKRRSKMAQLQHHRSQQELGNVPSRALVSHSALPEKDSTASASTPVTPTLRRVKSSISATTGEEMEGSPTQNDDQNRVVLRNAGDSDSDTACGFDSNWKTVV